jgi:hypothetical protein
LVNPEIPGGMRWTGYHLRGTALYWRFPMI